MLPDELTKKWGFSHNPFSEHAAEDEERLLGFDPGIFFVPPPYFDEIVGDPERPKSSVVLGDRGAGKTYVCNRMKQELSKKSVKFLLIDYSEFSENNEILDKSILMSITLNYHIDKIINLILKNILDEFNEDSLLLNKLDSDRKSNLEWLIYKYNFGKKYEDIIEQQKENQELQKMRNGEYSRSDYVMNNIKLIGKMGKPFYQPFTVSIRKQIKISLQRGDFNKIPHLNLLEQLGDLIKIIGFTSIYVVIDKIDEDGLKNFDFNEMGLFMEPLLTDLKYMQLLNIATKLFIPTEVKDEIGPKFRTDRIDTISLDWKIERLSEMLVKRLRAFSGESYSNLELDEEFIEDNLNNYLKTGIKSHECFVESESIDFFSNNVLYYSASNPRNLIRLIGIIISELCDSQHNPKQINESAIIDGIRRFIRIRKKESDAEVYFSNLKNNIENFKDKEIYSVSFT